MGSPYGENIFTRSNNMCAFACQFLKMNGVVFNKHSVLDVISGSDGRKLAIASPK